MTPYRRVVIERVRAALGDLAEQASVMETTCKNPPCRHAWGLRYAIAAIEEELNSCDPEVR